MKQLLFALIILAVNLSAQDTLSFKNGEKKAVKVIEVGLGEIKYNRWDNLNGPTYVINKTELVSIRYSNGSLDKFGDANNSNPVVAQAPSAPVAQPYIPMDRIVLRGARMYYHEKMLSEHRLMKMIYGYSDADKQVKLQTTFNEMKSYKRKQHTFNALGLGVGIGAPVIGLFSAAVFDDVTPFLVGGAIGLGVGITSGVLTSINKRHRIDKLREVVRIYNGDQ